jgi:Ala-tRNA(Pro) deacylase
MNTLQRCQRYLKQNGIRFAHSIHPPAYTACEVASAECMPLHDLAKVVVYSGDNGYGMLVLPADYVADLDEVRRLLGLAETRLATESELIEVFPDCEAGAMPPFGSMFNVPVLMDETIATAQFMVFNAGTHQDVLRMSVADFHKLVNPLVAAFAVKAPDLVTA